MSAWSDIVSVINKLPGASDVNKVGHDVSSWLGSQQLPGSTGNPHPPTIGGAVQAVEGDVGSAASGLSSALSGGSTPTSPANAAAQVTTNNLLQQLSGLNYGQTQGSGAASLATQLMKELQNLPAADAEKVLAQLTKNDPTVASDLSTDENPQPSTTSAQNYGFDPLSLGQEFQTTVAPWLAQQQALSNSASSSLASQMQGALKEASPAMQQAFSVGIPALEDANQNLNAAANQELATAPQWDQMVSALTNAVNQAKLTQAAAQNEPYVAAGAGTGTTPTNSAAAQSAQQTLNALTQKVLGTS